MAQFVYIDETGSVGRGARRQPQLILAAVIVDESAVQDLARRMREVAQAQLGWVPADLELHGVEIWQGMGYWEPLDYPELLAVYEGAVELLEELELHVAHSTINKAELRARHGGAADDNAYLLALQFLLEKIDLNLGDSRKIVIADETKEQQLRAVKMVADMQQWGGGEVPGRQLVSVIDSLHFARSNASAGVQMADLVAYLLQRGRARAEGHPDAQAARTRMLQVINGRTVTWREPWPPRART